MAARSGERSREILEALARELEARPGERLTTASLAAAVGVSEAALYRHFPSKARMYEALIEFAEQSVFSRVNRIMDEESAPARRCELLLSLALGFAERNPGINRVLAGDALAGESERVRRRAASFLDRLETQLRQILREANLDSRLRLRIAPETAAALMMAYLEGRLGRFARGAGDGPLGQWEHVWPALRAAVFES